MVVVVDFGSQTAHLITRRLREEEVDSIFVAPEEALSQIKKLNPSGIILSGGPASVYGKGSPTLSEAVFSLGIPLLAICYGMQLMTHLLGGKVVSGKKEYGPATLFVTRQTAMTKGVAAESTVWMSHGDEVVKLPDGFVAVAKTAHVPYALVENKKQRLFGTLFHPEVEHSEYGSQILRNFLTLIGAQKEQQAIDISAILQHVREIVGESYVIGAVSGGVDSTVAAALTAKAIGKKLMPFYVDNGLMRP